jgi:hypothetical protein
MSPLILGAVWLLFVLSCFASSTPTGWRKRRVGSIRTGGQNETT